MSDVRHNFLDDDDEQYVEADTGVIPVDPSTHVIDVRVVEQAPQEPQQPRTLTTTRTALVDGGPAVLIADTRRLRRTLTVTAAVGVVGIGGHAGISAADAYPVFVGQAVTIQATGQVFAVSLQTGAVVYTLAQHNDG